MADTITFDGNTLVMGIGFDPPTLQRAVLFDHIPRTDTTKVTELGNAGRVFIVPAIISEASTSAAFSTLTTIRAAIGTSGTLSWSVDGVSDSASDCYLIDVAKVSRAGDHMRVILQFIRHGDT